MPPETAPAPRLEAPRPLAHGEGVQYRWTSTGIR